MVGTFTNFSAGFAAGVVANPIDIVYSRQAADELLPKKARRNYRSFAEGILRVNAEGILLRGAVASGLSYGLLLGSMSSLYDYIKEYMFFFFGAAQWLRPVSLIPTALVGAYLSLPFDNIKVRLHNMNALPDGRLPYSGVLDAAKKIFNFEANFKKYSNIHVFHAGFASYYIKLYLTLLIGTHLSDYAFKDKYKEGEFIEQGSFYKTPYIKVIPHEPNNRAEINKMILDIEPNKKFYTDEFKTKSFKI